MNKIVNGKVTNIGIEKIDAIATALSVPPWQILDFGSAMAFNEQEYLKQKNDYLQKSFEPDPEQSEWLSLLEKMTDEQKSALKIMAETFIGKKNTVKKKASNC